MVCRPNISWPGAEIQTVESSLCKNRETIKTAASIGVQKSIGWYEANALSDMDNSWCYKSKAKKTNGPDWKSI